jgi:ferrochelatase
VSYRAENVRRFCESEGVDLSDPGTRLVLSAHGTPRKYLDEGNRYEEYVEEYAGALAAELGVDDPVLGYQNHGNRADVAWTEPDVEDAVTELDAERVVVEPVSFVHEQSETLSELDLELREEAGEAGIALHRVPVPHAEPRFVRLLADLVEPLLAGEPSEAVDAEGRPFRYGSCRCKPTDDTWCLNAVDQPAGADAGA